VVVKVFPPDQIQVAIARTYYVQAATVSRWKKHPEEHGAAKCSVPKERASIRIVGKGGCGIRE